MCLLCRCLCICEKTWNIDEILSQAIIIAKSGIRKGNCDKAWRFSLSWSRARLLEMKKTIMATEYLSTSVRLAFQLITIQDVSSVFYIIARLKETQIDDQRHLLAETGTTVKITEYKRLKNTLIVENGARPYHSSKIKREFYWNSHYKIDWRYF